jgi:hypothetical protein
VRVGTGGTGTNSMAATCRPGSGGGYAVRQLDVDPLRPRLILVWLVSPVVSISNISVRGGGI